MTIPGFTGQLSLYKGSGVYRAAFGSQGFAGKSQIGPQQLHLARGCRCYGTLHCFPPPIGYCYYGPPYRCYCW
jgi:hypothetical protein